MSIHGELRWSWVPEYSTTSEVTRVDALADDPNALLDPEYYRLKPASKQATFTTEGMTQDEYDVYEEMIEEEVAIGIHDQNDKAWEGMPISISGTVIAGNTYIDDVKLTLLIQ